MNTCYDAVQKNENKQNPREKEKLLSSNANIIALLKSIISTCCSCVVVSMMITQHIQIGSDRGHYFLPPSHQTSDITSHHITSPQIKSYFLSKKVVIIQLNILHKGTCKQYNGYG